MPPRRRVIRRRRGLNLPPLDLHPRRRRPPPAITGGYRDPFRMVLNITPGRIDQGVDYSGYGPVFALGPGRVELYQHNFYRGLPALWYRLTSGPLAGQVIYFGEHVTFSPHVMVRGAPVSDLIPVGVMHGGVEIGLGDPSAIGTSYARTHGGYAEGYSTAAGVWFSNLLGRLPGGAGRGRMQPLLSGTYTDPRLGSGTRVNDPLWNLLGRAGFGRLPVPGEPHGLTAHEMAWCVAMAESGGNLSPGGNLFQFVMRPPRDPLTNARRALAQSFGGTMWVAWCTTFGGPRVGGAKANCGHRGPNYLRTVGGISPAYVSHIPSLPDTGVRGRGGPGGSGPGRRSSYPAAAGPPATCADKKQADHLRATGQLPGWTKFIPVAGPVAVGAQPAAQAAVSTASFFAHLPTYLKIAGGGVVMIAGVAFLITGATGGSTATRRLVGAFGNAPGVRTALEPARARTARSRAIQVERSAQRQRAAQSEAESRLGTRPSKRGARRAASRKASYETRVKAEEKAAEAEGRTPKTIKAPRPARQRLRVTSRRQYRRETASGQRAAANAVEAEEGSTNARQVVNLRRRERRAS